MSYYQQQQAPPPHPVYPPPPRGYPPAEYTAPPPAGYPAQDYAGYPQGPNAPVETQQRGDGFWKGRPAAAIVGWDEETLLLASLIVEDTAEREAKQRKRSLSILKTPTTTLTSVIFRIQMASLNPKSVSVCKYKNGGTGGLFSRFKSNRREEKVAVVADLSLAPGMKNLSSNCSTGSDVKANNPPSVGAEANSQQQRKTKPCWSLELHGRFVNVLQQLGGSEATPKQITELMKVDGLTNDEIKCHLQIVMASTWSFENFKVAVLEDNNLQAVSEINLKHCGTCGRSSVGEEWVNILLWRHWS